jgi:hypothetical protein
VDSHQSVSAELLFGNAITLDKGVLLPSKAISENRTSLSTWASEMLHKQKQLLQTAQVAQQAKDQLHMAEADPRRTTYAVGEYVLVGYHPQLESKAELPISCPFRVLSSIGDRYRLASLIDGRDEEVHLARLHPYHFDTHHLTPRDAAMRDVLTLFEVKAVLDHH